MAKKLGVLFAAVAVLAFAVPAMASAASGLTDESQVGLIPVKSAITGTNIGTVTTTDPKIGNITCEHVMLDGKVTKDEAAGVEGEATESTSSECFNQGSAISITNIKLTKLSSTAAETGTVKGSFSFTADLPAELTCSFTATEASGTYTTNTDKIKFEKAALTVTPKACGTATLDGEFTLSTPGNGDPIFIM